MLSPKAMPETSTWQDLCRWELSDEHEEDFDAEYEEYEEEEPRSIMSRRQLTRVDEDSSSLDEEEEEDDDEEEEEGEEEDSDQGYGQQDRDNKVITLSSVGK